MAERRRPGAVRDSILSAFDEAEEGHRLSVADIRDAVSADLGEDGPLVQRPLLPEPQHPRHVHPHRVAAPTAWSANVEAVYVRPRRTLNTTASAWLKKRTEESIHAVVTDPPYGADRIHA